MNEERLERLIADVLDQKALVSPRPMPPGTTLRVRTRQGMTALLAIGLTIAVVIASTGLVSALRRPVARPGDRQIVHPPTVGVLPSPQATAPLNDATEAPRSGSTSEDTRAVSVYSWEPYTDQVEGQEAYLVTQKHVVAYGHVKGLEWSLAAYETRAYTGPLERDFKGGPCGDLYIGDQGDYGGMTFCLHTDETAADAQFAMAGFGNGYVPEGFDPAIGPPISGYAGIVGDAVDRVELRLSNGETQDLALHRGPAGVEGRYFVVFVDDAAEGRIVALAPDGSELARGGLCLGPVPQSPDNLGCGKGLHGVSSVVTIGP
jgi:hypothetical protein